jgi:hypothetical protein
MVRVRRKEGDGLAVGTTERGMDEWWLIYVYYGLL